MLKWIRVILPALLQQLYWFYAGVVSEEIQHGSILIKVAGKSLGQAMLPPGKICDSSCASRKWGGGGAGEKAGPHLPETTGCMLLAGAELLISAVWGASLQPDFFSPQEFSPHLLWVMRTATCASDPVPGSGTTLLIRRGPSWCLTTSQQMHSSALPVQNILHKICFKNYMCKFFRLLNNRFLKI